MLVRRLWDKVFIDNGESGYWSCDFYLGLGGGGKHNNKGLWGKMFVGCHINVATKVFIW